MSRHIKNRRAYPARCALRYTVLWSFLFDNLHLSRVMFLTYFVSVQGGSMPNTSSSVPFLLSSSMNSLRSRRPSACLSGSQGSGFLQQLGSGMVRQLTGSPQQSANGRAFPSPTNVRILLHCLTLLCSARLCLTHSLHTLIKTIPLLNH